MADTTFGKYRLLAELGHGGMADVFLAIALGPAGLGFSKLVVIKRLRPNLVEDPEFLAMLIDEARIAARLNHPNLVQTHEVGDVDGQYFIAMEYLDGQPLHRIQNRANKKHGGVPTLLQYHLISEILAGLHCAHELRDFDGTPMEVVHRDVTPQNIFVTYDGQVKVVDFGIAKAIGRASQTREGVVKGKVGYMAPEQAGLAEVDRRADIFSVGVMLWEAAAGRRLWKDMQDVQVVKHLVTLDIPASPRAAKPDVPLAIDQICKRALGARPEDRYATAAEMQAELDAFLREADEKHKASKSTSGGPIAPREIGRYVSDLFAEQRAQLKGIIERQLATMKSEIAAVSLPASLSLDAGESRGVRGRAASTFPRKVKGSLSSPPTAVPTESAIENAETVVGLEDRIRPAKPARRARSAAWVIVLGGVGVGAVAAWLGGGGTSPPPPEPVATEQATPASSASASASPAQSTVTITVRATPSAATFSIDDGPPQANPFVGELPRDGREHVIRAEASGYQPKKRTVVADQDAELEMRLDKVPAAAGPTPPPRPTPANTAKKQRDIDKGDPYKPPR